MVSNGTEYVLKHTVNSHRIVTQISYGYVTIDNVLMKFRSIVMNDEPGRMWEVVGLTTDTILVLGETE
jgi:hypothetical protein